MELDPQYQIKEACGVFGIYDLSGENTAPSVYYGLLALQHRGQESCGIAVCDTTGPRGNITFHKGMGLVSEVFKENTLQDLSGNLGIGHVRYSTTGAPTLTNAQPLVLNYAKGTLALAHNGNLVNAGALREELERTGTLFHTTTDSEVIACCIARERMTSSTVEEAIRKTASRIRGAYGLVIASPRKLIGVRDPLGLKPLCLGTRDFLPTAASVRNTAPTVSLNTFILPGWTAPWTGSPSMTPASGQAPPWQKPGPPRRTWSVACRIPASRRPRASHRPPGSPLALPFIKTAMWAGPLSNPPRKNGKTASAW